MRNFGVLLLLCISSFAGGATAQIVGGNAQTIIPAFINYVQQVTGTTTGASGMIYPQFPINRIWITADSMDASQAGANGATGLQIEHDINSASAKSNRSALAATIRIQQVATGQTGSGLNFNAMEMLSQVEGNLGGSGTGLGQALGGVFGIGANAIAGSSATNLDNLTGMEIDLKAQSGSSMRHKSGVSIATLGAQDQVHGAT